MVIFIYYQTRNGDLLSVPMHKLKKYEMCVTYQGIKMYSKLPQTIKSLNRNMFKKVVKELLFANKRIIA